jgi:hypothetical protein
MVEEVGKDRTEDGLGGRKGQDKMMDEEVGKDRTEDG